MSHVKKFDARTDDCNTQRGKTCSQSIFGELHLTALVKFRQMKTVLDISPIYGYLEPF
jgi:hypothetical protein